ncbi:MAG: FecR family protein [Sulfuricurvum sp.]|nr:FecR family protein [Sulfuricurvum sp.]
MKINFLIAAFSFMTVAFAGEPIGIIKNTQGEVFVKRNNAYVTAVKGEELYTKDILQTSVNSSVGLSFNDGTTVSVGPKSMLRVDDYLYKPYTSEYNLDLSLQKGTAAFESGKIGKLAPKKVAFRVPQGLIGIRGTKFVVEVE